MQKNAKQQFNAWKRSGLGPKTAESGFITFTPKKTWWNVKFPLNGETELNAVLCPGNDNDSEIVSLFILDVSKIVASPTF